MAERFPYVLNVIAEEARVLAGKMQHIGSLQWLSDGAVFDIGFAGDPVAVLTEARNTASGIAADVNIVSTQRRRKKLLVADMDSTIISCECLDELADMAGLKPRVAAITERAMRGEIEFAPALRERVALLAGLPLAALERVYAERVKLNSGAKALVSTMRAHGAKTLLVSGGFTYFTQRVARDAGFESDQANSLLDDGARLLGTVAEPVLGREAKLKALEEAVTALRLDFADALAVGDGANDLAMIERASLGVAYHAKPVVAAAAGASIEHGDLTALLYLQGYKDAEILSV